MLLACKYQCDRYIISFKENKVRILCIQHFSSFYNFANRKIIVETVEITRDFHWLLASNDIPEWYFGSQLQIFWSQMESLSYRQIYGKSYVCFLIIMYYRRSDSTSRFNPPHFSTSPRQELGFATSCLGLSCVQLFEVTGDGCGWGNRWWLWLRWQVMAVVEVTGDGCGWGNRWWLWLRWQVVAIVEVTGGGCGCLFCWCLYCTLYVTYINVGQNWYPNHLQKVE